MGIFVSGDTLMVISFLTRTVLLYFLIGSPHGLRFLLYTLNLAQLQYQVSLDIPHFLIPIPIPKTLHHFLTDLLRT